MDTAINGLTSGRINYDAEFCGKVPLHQTNQVQPHGLLLVVKTDDLVILQGSENAEELLGTKVETLIGRSLNEIINNTEVDALRQRLANNIEGKIPVTWTIEGKNYGALLQKTDAYFIAEIEKEEYAATDTFVNVYQELKYVMASIDASETADKACAIVAREIKRLSGFDKVMIYRFDKNWNGEVIAEEKEEGMDVYMGLKFPASDVPKQARELYRRNPYRLIPNVDYQPIKLYPVINPLTHAFTDLTDSNLRSVVPVHLEYLRNMKVSASMSTRILKDGVLWGLIACHHRTPKYLSYQMCSVFELLSHIISAKISSLTNTDTHQYKSEMQHLLTRVMESVYKTGSLTVGLLTQEEALLKLLSGGGMALSLNRQVETIGAAPNSEDVRNLVFWLQTNGINKTYQHTNLSSAYEDAEEYVAQGSGLLALPIQPEKGDYILVFRPEVIQQTNWGGNPNEAVQFEPDRKTYHPRNSFQLWKETVSKTAMPWTETEVDVAESFRSLVMEYTLNKV